jgi:tetratricopeptide (TPR) repeat protein
MSRSLARPYALLLASILVVGSVPSAALAQDAQRGKDGDAGPGGDKQARSLFAQGQIHYSLGEYEQAIAAFRRAYELTSAPGLLFNIAQAHRLNGQCRQALEIYRHFIRLAPQSEYLPEAETQIAALVVRCGTPGPDAQAEPARHETPKEAVAPAPIAPVPSVTVQSEPPASKA